MEEWVYDIFTAIMSIGTGLLVTIGIILLVVMVLMIVAQWKMLEKAGKPGWHILIPFLNQYSLFEIAWGNGWYFLLTFLQFVPFVGTIAGIVVNVIHYVKTAHAFGKSGGYAVGLFFLPIVFFPILAFGDAVYYGPDLPANKQYNNAYAQNYPNNGQPMYYGNGQGQGYDNMQPAYGAQPAPQNGQGYQNNTLPASDNGQPPAYSNGNPAYNVPPAYSEGTNGYGAQPAQQYAQQPRQMRQSVPQNRVSNHAVPPAQPDPHDDRTALLQEEEMKASDPFGVHGSVLFQSGEFASVEFPLPEGEKIVIGRDPNGSQIVLPASYTKVSAKHCAIEYVAKVNLYFVTDMSANGIFYANGARMPAGSRVAVKPGTRLMLADADCSVRVG